MPNAAGPGPLDGADHRQADLRIDGRGDRSDRVAGEMSYKGGGQAASRTDDLGMLRVRASGAASEARAVNPRFSRHGGHPGDMARWREQWTSHAQERRSGRSQGRRGLGGRRGDRHVLLAVSTIVSPGPGRRSRPSTRRRPPGRSCPATRRPRCRDDLNAIGNILGIMASLFISYRRTDSVEVLRLCARLRARFGGVRLFLDVEDIAPGMPFAEALTSTWPSVSGSFIRAALVQRKRAGSRGAGIRAPRSGDGARASYSSDPGLWGGLISRRATPGDSRPQRTAGVAIRDALHPMSCIGDAIAAHLAEVDDLADSTTATIHGTATASPTQAEYGGLGRHRDRRRAATAGRSTAAP